MQLTQTLNNLNTLLKFIQGQALTIGITLGGLMVVIYAIIIMMSGDTSVKGNMNRWEKLQTVLICAGLIAASGILISFAQGLGNFLTHPFTV